MLNQPFLQRGITMMEVMVSVAVIAIAMAIGAPALSAWMQNVQVRTTAESVLTGLQLARAEAVRRNTAVRFNLTDANGTAVWSIDCVTVTSNCPAAIQASSSAETGANARVGIDVNAIPSPMTAVYFSTAIAAAAGMPAGITFDGLGRVPLANIGTDIVRIDVTNAVKADARRMVIYITNSGSAKLCDPSLSLSTNSRGCS
jgi:type IV fimbrial biogenesis protein FimT